MAGGSETASGIVPRVYKSGSIIYFEGDKSENIYILKLSNRSGSSLPI